MSEPTVCLDEAPANPPSKTCKRCGLVKPLTDFYRLTRARDGRRGVCAACCGARGGIRRRKNIEAALASERRRRERDREKVRERGRLWARANMDQQVEYQRQRSAGLKAAVLAHYGTVCACCGTTERLSVDHVNGDGKQHRINLFGSDKAAGRVFYRWLIKNGFPEGYQTLCARCNTSKGTRTCCRIAHKQGR